MWNRTEDKIKAKIRDDDGNVIGIKVVSPARE